MEEEEKEGGKMKRLIFRVGKKMVLTGVVITSTPILVPPLMVGFVFAVPFCLVFATYACTDKLMSKLLSSPIPPPLPASSFEEGNEGIGGGEGDDMDMEEEEEFLDDTKETLEMRIELLDGDQEGVDENAQQENENLIDGGDVEMRAFYQEKPPGLQFIHDYCGANEEEDYNLGKEKPGEEGMEEMQELAWEIIGYEEDISLGNTISDEIEENDNLPRECWGSIDECPNYAEENIGNEIIGQEDAFTEDEEDTVVRNVEVDFGAMEASNDEGYYEEEEEKSLQLSVDNTEKEEAVPTMCMRGVIQGDSDANVGGAREEGIVMEEDFVANDIKDQEMAREAEGMMQEDKDTENVGSAVGEEVEIPVENISQSIEQGDGTIMEKVIQENGDGINVGITEEAEEIPVQETPISAEEEKQASLSQTKEVREEARDEELPLERISQSIEHEDEPMMEEKELIQENRDGVEAEAVPIEETSSNIELEKLPLLRETKDVGMQAQGEHSKMIGVEEIPVEGTEEETQPLLTEAKKLGQQAEDEENVSKVIQVDEMPVEQTLFKNKEKQQPLPSQTQILEQEAQAVENAGEMIEVEEIPAVGTYDSIEIKVMVEKRSDEKIAHFLLEAEKKSITKLGQARIASEEEIAREVADESGLYLFDEETSGSEFWVNEFHEDEVTPAVTLYSSFLSADLLDDEVGSRPHVISEDSNVAEEKSSYIVGRDSTNSVVHPVSVGNVNFGSAEKDVTAPTKEVLYKEEKEGKIWEQIDAIKKIVGYKASPQATCIDEINALYIFTGVEPPLEFNDSDLVEVSDKLRLLMAIIGVK